MDCGLKLLAENYFPQRLKYIVCKDAESYEPTEEIRINAERPLAVVKKSGLYFMAETGECVADKKRAAVFDRQEVKELVARLCHNSVYSCQEQLKQGFLLLDGGHRAGVSGRCAMENGKIKCLTDIYSVNIRIARQIHGAAESVLPYILSNGVKNTLIISPPGCGKTTMLRDIARVLGGERCKYRVAIADERGEIAAAKNGIPNNDVGCLTVVMDECPKATAITNLIRAMSPDVVITDEIGSREDSEAILGAVSAGASVICSAHGDGIAEAGRRCGIKQLFLENVFDIAVILSRSSGPGTVERVVKMT